MTRQDTRAGRSRTRAAERPTLPSGALTPRLSRSGWNQRRLQRGLKSSLLAGSGHRRPPGHYGRAATLELRAISCTVRTK